MKQVRKYIFTSFILLLILFFTFKSIYDKESLIIIAKNIGKFNIYYFLLCLSIVFIYFVCQGVYMKCILSTLKQKITLKKGVFYSLIEFFYSGITPSSTGGQPVELYYMTKDDIPIRKSYITLILDTLYFKIILLILGIYVLLFKGTYIFDSAFIYQAFFVAGFVFDALLIIVGFLLLFKTNLIKRLFIRLLNFLKRISLFKKSTKKWNPDEIMDLYNDEISFIKSHFKMVFFTFFITFIQRIALFSIIYIVYRSLGFSTYSYLDLLAIQVSVQIAAEVLPIPGGAGLSESMLHHLFIIIFASKMADIGMLLTRTFTFYIPLLSSGLVIVIDFIYHRIRNKSIE